LDYAISKNLTVGLGRASFKKEIDAFIKWRTVQQATGYRASPVSLVLVNGYTVMGAPWSDPTLKKNFSSRIGYYLQAIVGRKFSQHFTLQASPILLHRNFVETTDASDDLIALGLAGRIKLTKRTSLTFDYYFLFDENKRTDTHNPLSIGFDIETGGHVFQLHFTNAIGMNERLFLTETTNDWARADIQFGFNISRSFQIKK
jgi:hypothetical protein